MSFKDDFNLYVGAKYGIFKGIKATEGQPLITKSIQSLNYISKETDITALSWNNDDEEEILIGLSNQFVRTYDTNGRIFNFSSDVRISTDSGVSKGSICGLSRYNGALVTATESGHIKIMRYREEECINIYAGGPISKMRHSKSNSNIIGTGGLENELKLWDLNTGTETFTAKNVPNDKLQLRVKVWVSDHVFLPDSDKVVVGSRYGYVRLYDPKAQRRPVVKLDLPDSAVTCMAATGRDHTVLCGLAKGDIVAVDMRVGKSAQQYKGFLGGVRDIVCHPSEPYIVSVGLDRFLRVHHLTTKKILLKEYIVSRLNCVLMRSNFSFKASHSEPAKKAKKRVSSKSLLSDGQSDNEEAQQLDEIFNTMEEVVDGSSQKLKKPSVCADEGRRAPPSKKSKASLLFNPFAAKGKESTKVKNVSPKKVLTQSPQENNEDSDDDLMIISETVGGNVTNDAQQESQSEADEADGESDEFNEVDSDDAQEDSESDDN